MFLIDVLYANELETLLECVEGTNKEAMMSMASSLSLPVKRRPPRKFRFFRSLDQDNCRLDPCKKGKRVCFISEP